MAPDSSEKFDLKVVVDNFSTSLHDEDDVKLQEYLESYNELDKFFTLMGSIFSFVSSDLKSKVDIIGAFLSAPETSDKFDTVKKMIEYEKEEKLLHKNGYISGSRTLLRLHRGLDFIREFLRQVGELNDDDHTSTACRESYDQTLANYHGFFIRTGARLAMTSLPAKKSLLKKVCGEEEDVRTALELLPSALEATAKVYDRIETIYTVNKLHDLP